MNLLNKHPFEIWQSPKVTELLRDFFVANYTRGGISEDQAEEFVMKAWMEKDLKPENELRAECAELLLKIKAGLKIGVTEEEPFSLIDLTGAETFLDVGANRLAAINYYGRRYSGIKKFIAIDVIPQTSPFMFPERGVYYQVHPEADTFPVEPNSVDAILIQYSLHHFKDVEAIERCLNICSALLKPNGRFILMEESFTTDFDFDEVPLNHQLGIQTDRELTKRFYDLSEEERFEFIIANDWLINVHNPHMQWTGQYRTWADWLALLAKFNLQPVKIHNLGLRLNGRLKQGVHMVGEFRKV